jgi:AcrR family transcriptional regulator
MDDTLPSPDAKHRLIEVAIGLFADKGTDASVREICARAGVNVSAINYYFGDKERFYIETCKTAHRQTCGGDWESVLAIDETLPPAEQLTRFIHEMVRRMHAPADAKAVQLMMREMSNPTAAAREVVALFIQPIAFRLRAILQLMMPQHDPHALLMVGYSVIGQILYYRQNRRVTDLIFGPESIGSLSTEQVANHITRFTLAALGHATPIGAGA